MNTPLVSIIIPVYNVENYIKKCLDSVLNQSYENIEVILVDDGSVDGSPAICDEYAEKDDRINVIHKNNGGVSCARNIALECCKGEMVMFVDSDDYVSEYFCEKAVAAMLKVNADVVVFDYTKIDSTGNEMDKVYRNSKITMPDNEVLWDSSEFCKMVVSADSEVAGYLWNKCFKRTVIGDFRFEAGLPVMEDLLFVTKVATLVKNAVWIPDKLYIYLKNESGVTESNKLSTIYEMRAMNSVIDCVLKNFPENKQLILRDFLSNVFWMMSSVVNEGQFIKEGKKILLKYINTIFFCPKIGFKIKILYCILAFCPRFYFKFLAKR